METSDINHVKLLAPAKLNLGLKIVGRRPDGYHEIQSLFVPVSLYDEVVLTRTENSSKVVFTRDGKTLEYKNDTVGRALAQLLKAQIPIPSVRINITKVIPEGAGLGGGSSDAGVVLRYLYDRFSIDKSEDQLTSLALQVGADVPFFLNKGAALVGGIGEIVKPTKTPPFAALIVKPSFEVSTQEAFGWFDKETPLTQVGADATTAVTDGSPWAAPSLGLLEFSKIMKNDLEKVVGARHPEVSFLKKALRDRGALGSLMSGSGSSVYGVFKSLSEATEAREKLQPLLPNHYAFFVCEALV